MEPPTPLKYGTRSSKRKATSQEELDMQPQSKKSKNVDVDADASQNSQSTQDSSVSVESKTPEVSKTEKNNDDEDELDINDMANDSNSNDSSSSSTTSENDEIEDVVEVIESRVKELSQTPEASVTVSTRGRGGLRGRGRGRGSSTGKGRGSSGGRGSTRGRGRGGRGAARGGRSESQPAESNGKTTKSGRVTKQPSDGPPKAIRFRRGKEKEGDADRTALSFRKALLQQSYTKIAAAQRTALHALAEKSEIRLREDAKYHETLPEAKQVVAELHERHQKVNKALEARRQMEEEFQKKKLNYEKEYQEMLYKSRMEDAEELAEMRAMQGFAKITTGIKFENEWDLSDKDVTRMAPHLKVLSPGETAEDDVRKFNHVLAAEAISKKEKTKVPTKKGRGRIAKVDSEIEQPRVAAPIARRKPSLYQPEFAPTVTISTDGLVNARTPALTPAETSNPDEDSGEDLSEVEESAVQHLVRQKDTAKALHFDDYGMALEKRKGRNGYDPPNNRFVVENYIKYEDYEIGNSGQVWKTVPKTKSRRMESIKDKSLTTHLHYDRVVAGHDATRNQLGDLDEKWVELTKVHPITGLPIPGSINPDYNGPRSCFEPMRPTYPVEVTSNDSEEPFTTRPRTSLSRSVPFIEEGARFESCEFEAKIRLSRAMKALAERDALENRIISSDLLNAAASAASAAAAATAPLSTPKSTPRRRGYDPVRDITHPRDPSPPSPTVQRVREDTTNLSTLADVVSGAAPNIPPPPMPPVAFYPPPAPMHPSLMAGYREILPAPPRSGGGARHELPSSAPRSYY